MKLLSFTRVLFCLAAGFCSLQNLYNFVVKYGWYIVFKDSLWRYPDKAALHRAKGGICFQATSQTCDSAA
jgi:hypothetical protein